MSDQGAWPPSGDQPGGYPPPPQGATPPGQPYGYQPYGQQPYGPPPGWPPPAAQGTNGLAIAALVCGILPTGPVAIGLGIGALRQLGRRRQGGSGMAIAGIVLGSLWTVFIVLGIIGAATDDQAGGPGGTPATSARQRDVRKLAAGDCTTKVDESDNVSDVPVVPCAQPHRDEVYANVPVQGDKYPGLNQIQSTANKACGDALDKLTTSVKIPTDSEVFFLYPTNSSWVLGDHTITCLLELPADRSGRLLPNG